MNSKLLTVILMLTIGLVASPLKADPPDCAGPGVILKVMKYHLSLDDVRPICVAPGDTFTIMIINPSGSVQRGHVTVTEKENAGLPIRGSNEQTVNKLRVEVSPEAQVDAWYQFLIDVEGVGVLDPTVKVIPISSCSSTRSTRPNKKRPGKRPASGIA